MKLIRDFIAVLRRELGMFNSYKTFSRLSIGLPILSFVVFILLFRTGVPHDIPIAVYDPGNTPLSRQLSRMIDATPSARVAYHITDLAEGERMMKEGKIDAIVFDSAQFGKRHLQQQAVERRGVHQRPEPR